MSSRRNTDRKPSNADLEALLQLRMLRVPDTELNQLLPHHPPAELARRFCHHRITATIEGRVARALAELERLNVQVVTVADADYPERLHHMEDEKPPMLFYRGRYELIEQKIVAMVGTRRSTEYGNDVAEMLAADLTRYGIVVISGLALGIDAHAHLGALEAGGGTIAVLGCGVDVLYPHRNARLQERIAHDGLLLSEFAPGDPAMPHHFLQRNRLIAMLSRGVVVVEAGRRSGTDNTVAWATRYGIDVFAVPGPIGREASQGTNALIVDGAKLITSVRDIIEELPWPVMPQATSPGEPASLNQPASESAVIFNVLGRIGLQIDQIARTAQCDTAHALAVLAELELDGMVRQLPGKRFVRADARTAG